MTKSEPKTKIYYPDSAYPDILRDCKIAVIGYGNQGWAQALNLRDNGCNVIIGNNNAEYASCAIEDGFVVYDISTAVSQIGGLNIPAIEVTFKQEAIIDLFNEQAFGPAFERVLLNSISLFGKDIFHR